MRNLFIIYLLLFISSIAWGTRIDDLTVEDSTTLEYCTANRVPYVDASQDVVCSDITDTELSYLDGVTSLIQTQIDGKVTDGGTFTSGTLVTPQVDILTMSEETTPSNPSAGNQKLYFKSDGNLYKLNSSGLENQVGGGGSGGSAGKNYFSDPNTETIGNFTAFDDGAVSIPVDGTGGSPSFVSVALKTSGQFWGSSTLEITKASGNAQGEGANWATDITLDEPVTAGENLYLSMRYKTAAGYSTAGENIKLFYYRVGGTTTGPFPLNGIDGLGNYGNQLNHDATGRGQFHSVVQADSSTTAIRIIPMVVDTDTTAYTLEISDIKIDTSAKVYSLASSPAENYTPTYSAGMGTVTHDYATYRRVGEFMFLEGRFTTGTVTTGTANISLPSGHTINVGNNRGAGRWDASVGSTSDFSSGAFQLSDGDTVVYMGDSFSTAASSGTILSVGNANVILSSSTAYTWEVIVPITEWAGNSTNVLNSTQMDFQNAVVTVYSDNAPSIGTSDTKITYNNEEEDTHGIHSSGTITSPHSGILEVEGAFFTDSETWAAGNAVSFYVYKNGSRAKVASNNNFDAVYIDNTSGKLSAKLRVEKGDTIEIYGNSSVTTNLLTSSSQIFNYVTFTFKQDYSVIGNAGVPYNTVENDGASTTATSAVRTEVEGIGSGQRLTLEPGTWTVTYQGTMIVTNSASNGQWCRTGIYNTADTITSATPYGRPALFYSGIGSSTIMTQNFFIETEITVTEDTVFSVFVESSFATSDGNCRLASASWTGSVDNPDADVVLSKRRTK